MMSYHEWREQMQKELPADNLYRNIIGRHNSFETLFDYYMNKGSKILRSSEIEAAIKEYGSVSSRSEFRSRVRSFGGRVAKASKDISNSVVDGVVPDKETAVAASKLRNRLILDGIVVAALAITGLGAKSYTSNHFPGSGSSSSSSPHTYQIKAAVGCSTNEEGTIEFVVKQVEVGQNPEGNQEIKDANGNVYVGCPDFAGFSWFQRNPEALKCVVQYVGQKGFNLSESTRNFLESMQGNKIFTPQSPSEESSEEN